jgi:hypothetical protein
MAAGPSLFNTTTVRGLARATVSISRARSPGSSSVCPNLGGMELLADERSIVLGSAV